MKFRTVALVASKNKPVLVKELKTILNLYESKDYNISAIYTNQEFSCMREDVRPKELNIYATDNYVYEAYRSIRTVKYICRCK